MYPRWPLLKLAHLNLLLDNIAALRTMPVHNVIGDIDSHVDRAQLLFALPLTHRHVHTQRDFHRQG
jgi:hypothetical protein